MKEVHQGGLSSEAEKAKELAWLREHLAAFWVTAYEGYREQGKGAVVIDTTTEPLGEDTPFYYVPQARFEAQKDEVSHGLAKLISEYGPESQFVAVFIRPGDDELEFGMFQIRVGEKLVEAINAFDSLEARSNGSDLTATPVDYSNQG